MKTASLPDQETKRINEKKPLHTRVWRSLGVNEHPETASWSTQPVTRCDGGKMQGGRYNYDKLSKNVQDLD